MNKSQRVAEVVQLLKEEAPFCKDCVYFVKSSTGIEYSKCTYQKNTKDNNEKAKYLVSGKRYESKVEYHYCTVMRNFDCGPKGQFFVRRPPKVSWWRRLLGIAPK